MTPFGDRAVRFDVPGSIAERRALLSRLRGVRGVRDVVLCETVGAVVFEGDAPLVEEALAAPLEAEHVATATHVVPVVYDGEDLETVAASIGRSREEVIRLHADGAYEVAMLGFLPGFAYLRGLAPALALPRRAPRPRVPARSVAIGAEYTGIYPVASAGGWHLLGRALSTPRFELGDHVRFEAATAFEEAGLVASAEETLETARAHLVVTRMAGLAVFVDVGRAGQMHRGMPPGGPLVRSACARATASVAGDRTSDRASAGAFSAAADARGSGAFFPSVCAIELTGQLEVEARGGAVMLATSERAAMTLREGERFTLASGAHRVVYLAIADGFDAPIVEGSRNVLLAAGIGRPLKRGDVLCPASAPLSPSNVERFSTGSAEAAAAADVGARVVLRVGPDLTDELRAAIEAATFTVSPTSDRAGTRLVGPPLPSSPAAGTRPSTPMVEGAIELTPSGLLVLGPDHPTTGGYPVPAIVAESSRDAFFVRPLGASLRFTFR